ncbi:hypothetical protein GCM10009855_13920 [Gordonia cholesterolivorans]|uniref:Uncharacterized protein n=2 Tax=Gordonia cholesterolivorans TaxID=559625 RepID=A0ABN3HCL6_9ACTN
MPVGSRGLLFHRAPAGSAQGRRFAPALDLLFAVTGTSACGWMGDMTDIDDEFERTQPIGNAINAVARAEQVIDPPTMPDAVAARLDALIDDLTGGA